MLKLLFAIALLQTSLSVSAADVGDIYGSWAIAPEVRSSLPAACRSANYTITPSEITMRSGSLEIVASYEAAREGEGFVLHQQHFRRNTFPNCQGRPAEYVLSHYVIDLAIERVGQRLKVFFTSRADGAFIEFVRSESAPAFEK